jgi:hypothetical protein
MEIVIGCSKIIKIGGFLMTIAIAAIPFIIKFEEIWIVFALLTLSMTVFYCAIDFSTICCFMR